MTWQPYGTGAELRIGPIVCRTHERGDWLADVSWIGNAFRDEQTRHDSPDAAQRAAEATAATWLREEIASLTSALATLEAPPFEPSIRAVGHCEAPGCDDGPACACPCGDCREAVTGLR